MGQQVARSIEDIVRTGSNEHPLLSTVDIITGRDWGSQYPADIPGLSGVKQQKPLGITQILRNVLGLSTEYDRLSCLIRLEEGRHVRGEDQVTAAYHLSVFYGLKDCSENQRTIAMAVLDCINRFCKSPLDLTRSTQITDLIIEGFGLESMPRLMRDYRPLRNLGALVPNGDVNGIVSAMKAPEFAHVPHRVLMAVLGYNRMEVGKVPVLYYRP